MKFLVFIIFGLVLYFILDTIIVKTKYRKFRKWLAPSIFIFMLTLAVFGAARSALEPDIQCGKAHKIDYSAPVNPQSPADYFDVGNYQYDLGNCQEAVESYTKAIELNKDYSQAYNNRGYTYMRLRVYDKALKDFDRAIEINPDYVQALMNRGDIYNYYFEIDRGKAIADYDKVLSLVKNNEDRRNLAVCGHKLLAENGGWSPLIYLELLKNGITNAGCPNE
jgi:tetratricopeptide (TPR) repeat protein